MSAQPKALLWESALVVLTLFCMLGGWVGHHWSGFPHPLANFLYLLAYCAGGFSGLRAALDSIREGRIDIDVLMVLAALGAALIDHPFEGAMLLFLFSLSNVLQAFALHRTRGAIQSLMRLRPATALTLRQGQPVRLPVGDLSVGDIIVVRPGEQVPLDATVTTGASFVDESSLTGESIPIQKQPGDSVFAATMNQTGAFEARVARLSQDSAVEKLIQAVEQAQNQKAPTQRTLDRFERFYPVGVLLFTAGLVVVPLLFGQPFDQAFYRAITVMVVASPCALIISTPASFLSAIGGAARQGVLFKGGAQLEAMAAVRIVALDKTGTVTEGRPCVTDVRCASPDLDCRQVLRVAASVEAFSEHPLAAAVVREAKRLGLDFPVCADFSSVPGKGASASVEGCRYAVGSPEYLLSLGLKSFGRLDGDLATARSAGQTCILVAASSAHSPDLLGMVAIADTLRPDAKSAVDRLRAIGVHRIIMLTGDHQAVANAIASQVGIQEVHAGLLPGDKAGILRNLREETSVAMVGDGVNDAPALATATVGVAMGARGSDVAMETADVVLMGDGLEKIPFAIALSRQACRIVRQNLMFSVLVIFVLVVSALGFDLPLPLGVIGHEGSTVLVCLNGLRMLRFKS